MIERGHRFEDLKNRYTMDQVELFYKKAQEQKSMDIAMTAIAVRAAFGADKKEWKAYLESLGVKKKPKKITTKAEALRLKERFGRRK